MMMSKGLLTRPFFRYVGGNNLNLHLTAICMFQWNVTSIKKATYLQYIIDYRLHVM